jgi:hemerythrin superfamily protein
MDILAAISKDHAEFRAQMKTMVEVATDNPPRSAESFRSLYDHLVAHHESEEHVLFQRLKGFEAAKAVTEEALEEHKAIDLYLDWLKQSHKSERWEAKTSVLEELVRHHLDEEEDQVFAAARKYLKQELTSLGERFQAAEARRLGT